MVPAARTVQEQRGIPWQVMTAQAVLETGWGRYITKDRNTGRTSHNLFNIKGAGPAGSTEAVTAEYYGGKKQTVVAKFRAYHSFEESFDDYARLLTEALRYAPAMKAKDDPEEFARQLQACGYATDPRYAEKLISIMRGFTVS